MDLRDLVHALLGFDALTARQWIADAQRSGFVWTQVPVLWDWMPPSLRRRPVSRSCWQSGRQAVPTELGGERPAGAGKALSRPRRGQHAAPAVSL